MIDMLSSNKRTNKKLQLYVENYSATVFLFKYRSFFVYILLISFIDHYFVLVLVLTIPGCAQVYSWLCPQGSFLDAWREQWCDSNRISRLKGKLASYPLYYRYRQLLVVISHSREPCIFSRRCTLSLLLRV